VVHEVWPVPNFTSCIEHIHINVNPGAVQTTILLKDFQSPLYFLFSLCPQVFIASVLLNFLQILLNFFILVFQFGFLFTKILFISFISRRHNLTKLGVIFICHTSFFYSKVHNMLHFKGWIIRMALIMVLLGILVSLLLREFLGHVLFLLLLSPVVNRKWILFHFVADQFLCHSFLFNIVKALFLSAASFT